MPLFPQVSSNSFCMGWEEGVYRWEIQERTLRVKSSLRSLMIEGRVRPLREKAPLSQTEGYRSLDGLCHPLYPGSSLFPVFSCLGGSGA